MQASTAKNETRLPRAVLKISQNIADRIAARESKLDPAAEVPPAETPPGTDAVPPVEPEPAPGADPRESDPAYWKQRFKVTQGVLAAERSDRKVNEAKLHQRVTELQEQIAQLQASAPAAPTDLGKYFTPEEVEELGEDECRARVVMIEKAVKNQLTALVEKEIKPLREQRENQQVNDLQSRRDVFLDKLAELFPAYTEIDTAESGFHAWLAQENDDGIPRQQVLDRHVSAFNAVMVAKVFQDFVKTKAKPAQPPVAPHGSGASGPAAAPSQRAQAPLTKADIADFYKRSALGKVSESERVEFEARLRSRAG